MRLTIIILIAILSVGSIVISLGFLTTPEYLDVPEISSQYEKLEKYKNELEKINQNYEEILVDLENQSGIRTSNNKIVSNGISTIEILISTFGKFTSLLYHILSK